MEYVIVTKIYWTKQRKTIGDGNSLVLSFLLISGLWIQITVYLYTPNAQCFFFFHNWTLQNLLVLFKYNIKNVEI